MKKLSRLLIAEGLMPSREAAGRIKAGDYVRDTSQKGLRARRMFRVVRLGVGQALLVPATQEGDAGAVRALLENLEKVRPTYGDLLGHTYSVLANGVAWRMEAKGETFEEATRHMTSWRRGNVSPQTEALIREMVETGKAPNDIQTKTAARPIRQDRGAVKSLLDRIYRRLTKLSEGKGSGPIGNMPLLTLPFTLRSARGEAREITVTLVATTRYRSSDAVVRGGLGKHKVTGETVVALLLNGGWSWGRLVDPRHSKSSLWQVLAHELSHAADEIEEDPLGTGGSLLNEVDSRTYYNHPGEVRAHLREVYEEIRPKVLRDMRGWNEGDLFGLGEFISIALAGSRIWRQMEPHLSRKNRNLILKGLVTAFEDENMPALP